MSHTLKKMIKYFVIFVLPVLVDKFIIAYPWIAQMTIGALLVGLVDWLKHKVGLRLP